MFERAGNHATCPAQEGTLHSRFKAEAEGKPGDDRLFVYLFGNGNAQ